MNNSITNGLHAAALSVYTYLAWRGFADGREHFTLWVMLAFLCMLAAKILGVLAHYPSIENRRSRHNFVWILISIVFVVMNGALLLALHAPTWVLAFGLGVSAIAAMAYVRTLFTGTGTFALLALAMILIQLICASVTEGPLRFAWLCIVASNILWIAMERVRWLRERKYHNDIYHFALIASTWLLYESVATGLWEAPRHRQTTEARTGTTGTGQEEHRESGAQDPADSRHH